MPEFDECCVLIPAATLEDFPSDLSDFDARSLLAAWTILWHPRLLAQQEQIPAWYRADGPPDPVGKRLVTVPTASAPQLPDGYEMRARQCQECRLITGGSRQEMWEMLELDHPQPLRGRDRSIGVEDFFAAGFAALQIQVMTRRLRYTSNLDEIHLQNRIVAAAQSFLDGQADASIQALHDVFDCLAEERDHYFSSDPHLIDLTLTSVSTIDSLLAMSDDLDDDDLATESLESAETDSGDLGNRTSALPTPRNVLIDIDAARALADCDDPRVERLRAAIAGGKLGWAGGGPAADACLDAMTLADAESVFFEAHRRTTESLGTAPKVYGRYSGSTPSDMTQALVRLGYCGMIPLDFANGTGHGDEAKVIIQSAGAQLEALSAKPIDVASDASFLTIGARLGEAIDSGEIATALLVHWPGQTSDAFDDLRRVASWSLALGRFWNLEKYFRDGERPYHHGTSSVASPDAANLLEERVASNLRDPISSLASAFGKRVASECQGVIAAMTGMVSGNPIRPDEASQQFAAAVAQCGKDDARLLINPHSVGCRESVSLPGGASKPGGHVFASTTEAGIATTTVDIPAFGFVIVEPQPPGSDGSLGKSIRRKLFGGPSGIAEEGRLKNEFMEVTISAETGGISGVYSGSARGNRFSMRLIRGHRDSGAGGGEIVMQCAELRQISSSSALGCIETRGQLTDAKSNSVLADFSLRYSLSRGSRVIRLDGEISPKVPLGDDPWHDYFACRVAVVTEAAIYRVLLRDKVHRARSRRIVAPLGILIDEVDRQTLVGASGMAFHRRVSDRFLDTLLLVKGETNHQFSLFYGFDVPSPVGMARARIAPPEQLGITAGSGAAEIGWIVHAAPKEILVPSLSVGRRRDGSLAAIVRIVQTRSQSCKASIRFLRDVSCVLAIPESVDDPWNLSLPADGAADDDESVDQAANDPSSLKVRGDLVSLSMPAHAVADLLVVFAGDDETA